MTGAPGTPATTPDAPCGLNTSANVIVPEHPLDGRLPQSRRNMVVAMPMNSATASALAAMRTNPTWPAAIMGGAGKAPNTVSKRCPAAALHPTWGRWICTQLQIAYHTLVTLYRG
jgi:hypothetical protein